MFLPCMHSSWLCSLPFLSVRTTTHLLSNSNASSPSSFTAPISASCSSDNNWTVILPQLQITAPPLLHLTIGNHFRSSPMWYKAYTLRHNE
ncbi:hypothetical protein K440DRAFT_629878 [Wilcoxina mikolae CBS 423.85]|nr:hypothetical protein K440DRAFT_629878 [Wilcoxina mikolae CBS 423.85]